MQRIVHEYSNKHPIFYQIERVYEYISDYEDQFDDIVWLDPAFEPLNKILFANVFNYKPQTIKKLPYSPIEGLKVDSKEITVLLSGGKDSAAVAYYYKMKGYTVHLYHAAGVNKAYGDERKAAQAVADYLGLDLFVDHISLVGKHKWIEHPLKNYILANGAIHYCLNKGYSPVIATGNFNQSHLDTNPFDICAGDCIEMWQAYEKIVQVAIPQFRIEVPFASNQDTFDLLREDWDLFSKCVSCMSPYRFRAHWKHRAEEKYNVRLFENRCGCCWKCCMEGMWLMDIGAMDYNQEFYRHCYDILVNTLHKETGEWVKDSAEVWDHYMFYPMNKSKDFWWLLGKTKEKR